MDSQMECQLTGPGNAGQLENEKVGVCIWAEEDSDDYKELRETAEELLRSWPSLQQELLKLVKKELIATGWLKPRSGLTNADARPFSFGIRKDEFNDDAIGYDFSFNVPKVLREDESVEVARYLDGSGGTSEVRCTE